MKVDVIIPVYNQEAYLADAIQSVLSQRHLGTLFVVDAGSSDASADIAQRYPRVCLLRSEKPCNAATARNIGVAQATSSHIAFLDSDDVWHPDKLRVQVAALCENALIFARLEQFISAELSEKEAAGLRIPEDTEAAPHVGTLLCSRKLFDAVGPFDESLDYGEFIDWFLRAKDQGIAFSVLEQTLLRRRIHLNNTGLRRREDRSQLLSALRSSLRRRGELEES